MRELLAQQLKRRTRDFISQVAGNISCWGNYARRGLTFAKRHDVLRPQIQRGPFLARKVMALINRNDTSKTTRYVV